MEVHEKNYTIVIKIEEDPDDLYSPDRDDTTTYGTSYPISDVSLEEDHQPKRTFSSEKLNCNTDVKLKEEEDDDRLIDDKQQQRQPQQQQQNTEEHACTICGKSFTRLSWLHRHELKHHSQVNIMITSN